MIALFDFLFEVILNIYWTIITIMILSPNPISLRSHGTNVAPSGGVPR